MMAQSNAQSNDKGISLFEAGNYAAAKTVFLQNLRQDANNAVAIEYLGDISFKQEKWSDAASRFKSLVEMDDANPVYHYKYAGAIGLLAKNNKLKALFLIDDIKFHFKKAASLDDNYVEARLALVQLFSELPSALGGSKSEAEKYAEQIKTLNTVAYKEALKILKG